jgi:hypothetical protein
MILFKFIHMFMKITEEGLEYVATTESNQNYQN